MSETLDSRVISNEMHPKMVIGYRDSKRGLGY